VPVKIEDIINQLELILQRTTDAKTKEQLTLALQNLRQFAQDAETERNNLQATVNQQQATITQLQATVATLQQQSAAQAREIEDLKKRLGGDQRTSSATPLNLAQSFKGVIETIQTQARQTPGVATTIKGLDIEVKGLVQVGQDNATALVLPSVGSQIDPNSLSTMRVSFGAIPVPAPEQVVPPTAPRAAPPAPEVKTAEAEKPKPAKRAAKKAAKDEKAKKGARRTKRAK